MIPPPLSHPMASALCHVLRREAEAWERLIAPGGRAEGRCLPAHARVFVCFPSSSSTGRARGGGTPTAHPQVPALTRDPSLAASWCICFISRHTRPPPLPLPGSAFLMEQRPGTVRAELEAKCIFSLGNQTGAGVLHPAQFLAGNFELVGSFLPH